MTYIPDVTVPFLPAPCAKTPSTTFYLPLAETVNNICFLFFFFPPPCAGSAGSLVVGVVTPFALDAAAHPTGDVSLLPLIREIMADVSLLFCPKSACRSAEVNPLGPPALAGRPGNAAAEGGFGAFFWPLALAVEKLTERGTGATGTAEVWSEGKPDLAAGVVRPAHGVADAPATGLPAAFFPPPSAGNDPLAPGTLRPPGPVDIGRFTGAEAAARSTRSQIALLLEPGCVTRFAERILPDATPANSVPTPVGPSPRVGNSLRR